MSVPTGEPVAKTEDAVPERALALRPVTHVLADLFEITAIVLLVIASFACNAYNNHVGFALLGASGFLLVVSFALWCLGEYLPKSIPFIRGYQAGDSDRTSLSEVTFESVDEVVLRKRKFFRCSFEDCDFGAADLAGAVFTDCNLKNCVLAATKNFSPVIFPGSDLTCASLPDAYKEFGQLVTVEELSKNAGKVLVGMLAASVYLTITAISTKDSELYTGEGLATLPLANVQVSVSWIFILGPLIVLGFYSYLNLYLQRLWECLVTLPALFPDGRMLDEVSYPWLVTDYIVSGLPLAKAEKSRYANVQSLVYVLTVLVIPPLVIALMWWRYLSRRDPTLSFVQCGLLLLTICLGGVFAYVAGLTLRSPRAAGAGNGRHRPTRIMLGAVRITFIGCVLYVLTRAAISGASFILSTRDLKLYKQQPAADIGNKVYDLLYWIQTESAPNFSKQNLSPPKTSWNSNRPTNQTPLAGRLLNIADANFENSSCDQLLFDQTNLTRANMDHAAVNGAKFVNANLDATHFEGSGVTKTIFIGCSLNGTAFSASDLTNTIFDGQLVEAEGPSYAAVVSANEPPPGIKIPTIRPGPVSSQSSPNRSPKPSPQTFQPNSVQRKVSALPVSPKSNASNSAQQPPVISGLFHAPEQNILITASTITGLTFRHFASAASFSIRASGNSEESEVASLNDITEDCPRLAAEKEAQGLSFEEMDGDTLTFEDYAATKLSMSDTRWDQVTLKSDLLTNASIVSTNGVFRATDCAFSHGSFSYLIIKRTSVFSEVLFSDVTMNRCQFGECTFIGSDFENCKFSDVTVFSNCTFKETNFEGSRISSVGKPNPITGLTFTNCSFNQCDLDEGIIAHIGRHSWITGCTAPSGTVWPIRFVWISVINSYFVASNDN